MQMQYKIFSVKRVHTQINLDIKYIRGEEVNKQMRWCGKNSKWL